jgi:hypothetical protein
VMAHCGTGHRFPPRGAFQRRLEDEAMVLSTAGLQPALHKFVGRN